MLDWLKNFYWELGVDLGSSNILVILKDRGIVVDEPSLVARVRSKRWVGLFAPKQGRQIPFAYGYKAKEIVSREPMKVEVIAPIKNGVLADLVAVEELVNYYLKLVYEVPSKYPKFFKPRVVVAVPSSVTNVQKRAVKSIFIRSGAGEVVLVENVVAATIGIGSPITKSQAVMVLDVGGGKTEAAIVSMGGVVLVKSTKTAGEEVTLAIMNYLKMKYGMLVGFASAEKLKLEIGSAEDLGTSKSEVIRGRDLETGLPKSVRVGESEIREAVIVEVQKIVRLVKDLLEEVPPELMEDILNRGILMIGNGSKLRGLGRLIEKQTKIGVKLAEDAGWMVAKGLGELLEKPDLLRSVRMISNVEN